MVRVGGKGVTLGNGVNVNFTGCVEVLDGCKNPVGVHVGGSLYALRWVGVRVTVDC